MQVRVQNIDERGLAVAVGLQEAWAAAAATEALDAPPEALDAALTVAAPDKQGVVRVAIRATAHAPARCDRCGDPVARRATIDTTLAYAPSTASDAIDRPFDEDGIELDEDDLDLGWYEDGSLALADVLIEALALGLPSRTVCEDTDGCDERTAALLAATPKDEVGHPAFATLKNLKPRD